MQNFKVTKENIDRLTGSKHERAVALWNKLCFMEKELEHLQKVIKQKGWTEPYQNGNNQFGTKNASEGQVYNTLVKNYMAALKQLDEMLPPEQTESKLEAFLNED